MGIKNLPKLLRPSNEHPHSLEDLKGQTLGIDIMIWLVRSVTNQRIADLFHQKPLVPLSSALGYITKLFQVCKRLDIRLIVVFDGARPLPKQTTTDGRDNKVSTAEGRMAAMILKADPADFNDMSKARKSSVHVRSDLVFEMMELCRRLGVSFISAPFEVGGSGALHHP